MSIELAVLLVVILVVVSILWEWMSGETYD